MTTCPEIGTLRAGLDGALPPAQQSGLTAHLAACPTCRARAEELRRAADFAGRGLALLAPEPDPAAAQFAWRRFQARLEHQPRPLTPRERITSMFGWLASRSARLGLSTALAGLVVALTLALTPMGSEAARQALSVFRVTTFKAITFEVDQGSLPQPTDAQRKAAGERRQQPADPTDMRDELQRELAAVGITLATTLTDRTVREVATVAEAKMAAPGAPVQTITALPAAYQKGGPKVYMAEASKTSAVADLDKVRQALRDRAKDMPKDGKGAPAVDPNKLPGVDPNAKSVSATVQTSFSVVQVWGEGEQALVLAQGPSPVLTLDGVDILALRDALVAMPNLPKATQDRIRSIPDSEWSHTLFIPTPVGSTVKDVRVGGTLGVGGEPALLILEKDGKGGGIFWQKGGTLYIVAGGGYGEADLLRFANSVK